MPKGRDPEKVKKSEKNASRYPPLRPPRVENAPGILRFFWKIFKKKKKKKAFFLQIPVELSGFVR
jgi:hypothetical protein